MYSTAWVMKTMLLVTGKKKSTQKVSMITKTISVKVRTAYDGKQTLTETKMQRIRPAPVAIECPQKREAIATQACLLACLLLKTCFSAKTTTNAERLARCLLRVCSAKTACPRKQTTNRRETPQLNKQNLECCLLTCLQGKNCLFTTLHLAF